MKYHALLLRLTVISWLLCTINAWGQYPHHTLPQYPERWGARWITHPDIDQTAYNLIHFRTTFDLKAVPSQFVVHVSGDNRYRLFVNGQEVGYGPQLADTRHWRYETLDLAPFLQTGSNSIAAEVMNWGVERSYGIMSFRTGFLLQGHSPQETIVNTGNNRHWKVLQNQGIHEKTVHWINGGDIVDGFYASNPTDSIIASDYPWGWQQLDYDDSHWKTPEIIFSKPKTSAGAGHGWILQPRTTPVQESRPEPLGKIARTSLADLKPDFRFGSKPLELPANSRHAILIDQGHVTLGYPKLQLSGGEGATVKVTYSEALYDEQNHKGHRDVIEEKEITGISDVIVTDGGEGRTFQPIWFRAFRFIQLDIETKDEPLRVDDFYNVFSASPVPLKAEFGTNNPLYQQVWDICWRGLKMCAQDNLLSDVYYEQMQYVGDLRPHLAVLEESILGYASVDTSKQIIKRAALVDQAGLLTMKVAREDNGGNVIPLTTDQRSRFKSYLDKIKPAGINIQVTSGQADKLQVFVGVYYNAVLNQQTIRENVYAAIDNYLKTITDQSFGGKVYLSILMDAIQEVEGVIDVQITQLTAVTNQGNVSVTRVYDTVAGYAVFHPSDQSYDRDVNVQLNGV